MSRGTAVEGLVRSVKLGRQKDCCPDTGAFQSGSWALGVLHVVPDSTLPVVPFMPLVCSKWSNLQSLPFLQLPSFTQKAQGPHTFACPHVGSTGFQQVWSEALFLCPQDGQNQSPSKKFVSAWNTGLWRHGREGAIGQSSLSGR